MFWSNVKDGFRIINHSLVFAFRYPWTLFPFLLTWGVFVTGSFYLLSVIDTANMSIPMLLLLAYGFYVIFSTLVSISSLILLELIEQKEEQGKMNILIAIKDSLIYDLYKTIPVILVWSLIKVIVLVLNMFAGLLRGEHRWENSANRAVNRLANRIEKGVRMFIFLILPGIALDDRSTRDAYEEASFLFTGYFETIISGYGLSTALGLIIYVPFFGLLYLSIFLDFPSWSAYVLIAYLGISWSFGLLIEQLFCGELYLWYSNVSNEVIKAKQQGRSVGEGIGNRVKPYYLKGIVDDNPFASYDNITFD